jgi:uncharacterized protein YbjT (DUF2867 family)
MSNVILVTGATGTVGSQVVSELAGRADVQVRATARDLTKVPFAAAPNVRPVLFNFERPETWPDALKDVDALFLVAPFTPAGVMQTQLFIEAAAKAGVKHIVKLSVIKSVGDITVGRWHAEIDAALKASGIAWTILQPGGFMQNFAENSVPRADGNIYAPVGDAVAAFIDTRDIAAVAAKALTESGHEGKEYTLTGPEDLSYPQAAQMIGEASGREIRFVDIPESAAKAAMEGMKMPDWMIQTLLELHAWSKASRGGHITNTVQEVLGRPARTFRQFTQDYAKVWKS